ARAARGVEHGLVRIAQAAQCGCYARERIVPRNRLVMVRTGRAAQGLDQPALLLEPVIALLEQLRDGPARGELRREALARGLVRSASAIASADGAETPATVGIRAASAFCTISNEIRPDTSSACPDSGQRFSARLQPSTLSTALWRPTSSRAASSRPPASNSPAACSPPVRANPGCAPASNGGSGGKNAAGKRAGSSIGGAQARAV